MSGEPVVVLGFQEARAGRGTELSKLNVRLGHRLRAPGLLRYQALRNVARPDRLCVYWLWRHVDDREALWASPSEPLRTFWEEAGPLWDSAPVVDQYRWDPPEQRSLCPTGKAVSLSPAPRTGGASPPLLSCLSAEGEDLVCEILPAADGAWLPL